MSKLLSPRRVLGALALVHAASRADASYKATTYYDSACASTNSSSSPTGLAIEFQLQSSMSCSETSCAADTFNGHASSTLGCGVTDPDAHASAVACTQEDKVVGFRLYDGHCIKTSDTTSIAYAVRTDTTVQENAFASPDCTGPDSSVSQWSSSEVRNHDCSNKVRIFAHVPTAVINEGYVMETYFTDSQCKTPNRILFKLKDVFVSVNEAACARNAQGLYYSRSQSLSYNVASSAVTVFGATTSYMIERNYYDANCIQDDTVSVYRADGECINLGDKSANMAFEMTNGRYTKSFFAGSMCSSSVTSYLRVDASVHTSSECSKQTKYASHYGAVETTPLPTNATNATTGTSTATTTTVATILTGVTAIASASFAL